MTAAGGEGALSPDEVALGITMDIIERFDGKKFDTEEIARSIDDLGPYQNVFLQEMDVMNNLLTEMSRSLKELILGFKGELTMSDSMDALKSSLYLDRIPPNWQKRAWPSLRPLQSWLTDFLLRLQQLDEWQNNPLVIPKVTWISGLYNPQSFLTAIMQKTAQDQKLELDKLVTWTDVTKKVTVDEVDSLAKDGGAYIIGFYLQGARWDTPGGLLERSKPKEMFCKMPVINVRAILAEKADYVGIYSCPSYKTEQRGPTYVFCAQLKTKSYPGKWVLAGVALIMDVV